MSRSVRWVMAVGVVLAAFGLCLWLARVVSWGWMPRGEADRWVVATAFATVAASAVGAAMFWWAGREDAAAAPAPGGRVVTQWAKARDQAADASGGAEVIQTGGDQNTSGPAP